jgi:hypothetical protein
MKKRSFYAILLVAIGLFISLNLVTYAVSSSTGSQSADTGGGHGTSSSIAGGVYIPD